MVIVLQERLSAGNEGGLYNYLTVSFIERVWR